MEIISDTQLGPGHLAQSVVTIGNFDGVHRGHQALIGEVCANAKRLGVPSVVYTFDPHPLRVLNPGSAPPAITDFEQKAELIQDLGAEILIRVRFDREYAARPAQWFAKEVLGEALGAKQVWIGPDFAFGKGKQGNFALLEEVGRQQGYTVHAHPAVMVEGERASSTRVRQAVADCRFGLASDLLGRPWALHGPIVKGVGRGRKLGFPTANLLTREECIPPPGVYAARACVEGLEGCPDAAVNIGANPTFGADAVTVEAFLPDIDEDLYGREMKLKFVQNVRGEIAFANAEALIAQITQDVKTVRTILSGEAS